MTALWRKMPWFKWFFSGTLTKNDVGFVSDQHIVDIHIPILILHAKVVYSLQKITLLIPILKYIDHNICLYNRPFKNYFKHQDDAVIPFELGYKLYQVALESRRISHNSNAITFVPFESDRALGHTFIYSAPEITDLIRYN